MNLDYLDFEQPIAELESKIDELRLVGNDSDINIAEEIKKLKEKSQKLTKKIYSDLSSWQTVQVARHPLRPYATDYISRIFTDFDELHGDRQFGDDKAIVGGIGKFGTSPFNEISKRFYSRIDPQNPLPALIIRTKNLDIFQK